MSEPRKLNTGGADSHRSVLDQQQYEQARLRAQQQTAVQGGRRSRRIQTPGTRPQPSAIEQEQAEAEARAREEAARLAPPKPEPPAQPTRAQLQAMELQRAAQQRKARSLHTPGASGNVRELDLNRTQSIRTAYDMNNDAAYEARRISRQQDGAQPMNRQTRAAQQAAVPPAPQQPQPSPQPAPAPHPAPTPQQKAAQELYAGIQLEEEQPPKKAPRRAKADKPADGGKPPKPPKKGGDGDGAGPYKGKGNKTKKKMKWWQVLLVTILVIALILGGTLAFIMAAIAPQAGGIKLNQLLNTPKEFQGKELNFLMVGIDRSSQSEANQAAGSTNDEDVNDGNTDMILYVHFNNETGEMKMLQIPRDTIVCTDRVLSNNYRINNIAKTQAVEANTMNIPALCEQVSKMYQLPIDGYMTIRLEMLVELVDLFGGIEMNIPFEMSYDGSYRPAGYQTLDGPAVEFVLRTRKIYPDGDIGRLNMQRQFYSALFRKLKSIGNIWDVAKLTPAVLNYMETDLSISKLVSFAVSILKMDSSKIMICQMPVKMGPYFQDQALVYPARQEDADLLNTYFRENTGPVDASALDLIDSPAQLGFDLSGYTATDANVQFMGSLMQADQQAQNENNIDGSHAVEYDVTTEEHEESGGDEAAAQGDAGGEAQPAA